MMKFINFTIFITILFFYCNKTLSDEKISIKIKINNEIITNFDIERERKYLNILNPNLKSLNDQLQIKIAKDSISKEVIKRNVLKKYFDLENEDIVIDRFIENFYNNLGFNNKIEFESHLLNFGWSVKEVEKKVKIEVMWNQFIFDRYKNQIKIDLDKLKNKIKLDENNKFKSLFNLSEIIFRVEKNNTYANTLNSIKKSISEIGFENTANLYSVSDSAKIGGKIGWIEENSLSVKLSNAVKSINVGEYTEPVKLNNGFIILKINNKKNEDKVIDFDSELKKLIKVEETKQLNNFSKIYFDKVKINTKINEY